MTKLDDALIHRLAHSECPKVYGHEAKSMAQEILAYRTAEAEAAKQAAAHPNPAQTTMPWPYGGQFP